MKRLEPFLMTLVSSELIKLRCRPKFDGIKTEEYADVMIKMRAACVNNAVDDRAIESEFVFTFDDGMVLQDQNFFFLTNDDYGELWIDRSVDYFAVANQKGVEVPDFPSVKLKPLTLVVDETNDAKKRKYKIIFSSENDAVSKESNFTVTGGPGDTRNISWSHGSYEATWAKKNWTINSNLPEELRFLLLSIIRMDEAINLELMPYALG